MKTVFDVALTIAEGLARRKNAELTSLSYRPAPNETWNETWVASFSTEAGYSWVEIEGDTSFERHLDDYEENYRLSSKDETVQLDEDGARALVHIGQDTVIVSRRSLGPYDDSDVGCQVTILVGPRGRSIHFVNTGQVILGGHASFKTYDQGDFEEIE